MFFDPIKLALAAAIAKAAKFTVYALGLIYFPRQFSKLQYACHDFDGKLSLHGFITGIIHTSIRTFIFIWFFAYVYNFLLMR